MVNINYCWGFSWSIDFYIIDLYDIYGELLTSKQQDYFEDYYFNNLTLAEMSENYNVSRNAVHKQIKEAEEKLIKIWRNSSNCW